MWRKMTLVQCCMFSMIFSFYFSRMCEKLWGRG